MTSTAPSRTPSVVTTPAGRIEGLAQGSLHVFKGIPFAEPPVGANRWKPPVPRVPWSGTLKATEFGLPCTQPASAEGSIYTQHLEAMSEDCLTLNLWAPADAKDAPVFVWIHGGALSRGASGEAFYDCARLAERGVVAVSINYRLGVLGYMAHPELSAESPDGISGNYGLLDQIEALRWIRANIAAFGGDAANVTIVGESAGALSVMYLMAAPAARGLIAKAIAQSAYMISMPHLRERLHGHDPAEALGLMVQSRLQCADLAALRAMDAKELTERATAAGYAPLGCVDGKVLPAQLVEVFDRGEQAPVPLLAGFNSGEIRSLTMLAPPAPGSAAEYEKIIRAQYLDLADEFLRLYPGDDRQESVFATTRDAMYGWTAERLARSQTRIGQNAYLYLWDHGYSTAQALNLHAFHASELPYLFGTFDCTPPLWPKIPDSPVESRLSNALIGYWTSFARTGTPSAANEPVWPAFGPRGAHMRFTNEPKPAEPLMPGMFELHEEATRRRKASGDLQWNWNVGILSPRLDQ